MQSPPPDDEGEWLEALRRYQILDTLPERDFDDLARTAGQICGTRLLNVTPSTVRSRIKKLGIQHGAEGLS